MIQLDRQKVDDDLSQKIHGNMILSVYSVKMVFLLPKIWYYPSVKNGKDDLLPKKDI